MTATAYKYDVAFSFLAGDSSLAVALHDEISEWNASFAFPRKQDELAGREGIEELKRTYGRDARVVVVLYRNGWGHTPWTGVEKEAIADRALQHQQNFLLVVVLDRDAVLPDWISPRRIYWDFHTYGRTGLAGAIKSRITELDGNTRPEPPIERARRVARVHKLEALRKTFRGESGIEQSNAELQTLFLKSLA